MIFYSYLGIGKTSLAKMLSVIQWMLNKQFFNTSVNKKKDLEYLIQKAKNTNDYFVIIIDEIHRLNKDKQDILLPFLETKNFIIFETTAENSFFIVNPAIRSYTQIIQLKKISNDKMKQEINNIYQKHKINIEQEIIEQLATRYNGDLRSTLNTLNILWNIFKEQKITFDNVKDLLVYSNSFNSKYGDKIHNLKQHCINQLEEVILMLLFIIYQD